MNNLAKEAGAVYLKNKLYFREGTGDLMQDYADLQERVDELGCKPRYLLVTDYQHLLAKDTKTNETLDIEFAKLPQYFDFFLAWNGIEKADFDKENPADVRAAERFAKLYDVVVKDNPDATRKGLNLFLIRILFCLFAEDTNIFEHDLFTNRVKQMTADDGSNFDQFIGSLFGVLDFEKSQRPADTPSWLDDFPYVDGDLFKDQHESLHFSAKSRKLIIEAGELLKWDQINPDILGSMIQAVASEDSRSHLGMHYTSVPNIMKVIKPLFLDGLREDFEVAKGHENKLQQLYDRIGKIKFMDPACGSGNFLIITYKELRQLEIDILIELNNIGVSTMYVPSVTLDQFYGIEIDDFACDVTRLSLWIAEHQMNVKLHEQISDAVRPTLPLQHAGAILCANALIVSWNAVLPHGKLDEVYVYGNPPYLGYSLQSKQQREELIHLFSGVSGRGYLDYCCGWYKLGSEYIRSSRAQCAFVSTNSVTQGVQVAPLWRDILKQCKITFAHRSFTWQNNAKENAAVVVVIIGLADINNNNSSEPRIYSMRGIKVVKEISPYLTDSSSKTIIDKVPSSLFGLPEMLFGSKPVDGGAFILTKDEYEDIIKKNPELSDVFLKYVGASEFFKGTHRYVLWLNSEQYDKYKSYNEIEDRVNKVRVMRKNSKKKATQILANSPYSFAENRYQPRPALLVPEVSSQTRNYIPMGYVDANTVVSNRAFTIYDCPIWVFGLLESRMHMVWMEQIGGRLKSDFNYSASLVYNTFPVPTISKRRKAQVEDMAYKLIDAREEEVGTLAELYGAPLAEKKPKPMNIKVQNIHQEIDEIIDRAYRPEGFESDEQRLEFLLNMYDKKVQSLG
jgi:hypothetical protein